MNDIIDAYKPLRRKYNDSRLESPRQDSERTLDEYSKEENRTQPTDNKPTQDENKNQAALLALSSSSSSRDRLLHALTGGKGVSTDVQNIINSITAVYKLDENDPFWMIVLLTILVSRGDEQMQMTASQTFSKAVDDIKKTGEDTRKSIQESIQDMRSTINRLSNEMEKKIERSVGNALVESDFESRIGKNVSVLTKNMFDEITEKLKKHLEQNQKDDKPKPLTRMISYYALAVAIGFVAGILSVKTVYESYFNELSNKISVYEKIIEKKN